MFAVSNGPVTWVLLWLAALIVVIGVTYLGRNTRRQWEEEAGYHDD